MLTIIGQILRIIGIGLAGLAGILLLFVLLVLFVPLRYRGTLSKKTEGQQVDIRIGWLFRLLSARVYWTGEKPKITLRIAGITLFDSTKPKKQKKLKDTKELYIEKKEDIQQIQPEITEMNTEKQEPEKQDPISESMSLEENNIKEDNIEEDNVEELEISEMKSQGWKVWNLLKRLKDWICSKVIWIKNQIRFILSLIWSGIDFLMNLKKRLKESIGKVGKLRTKAGLIQTFFRESNNRTGIKAVLVILKMVGKHVLPTKLSGSVVFGTGDAYSTAQILVYTAMFYGLYASNFDLQADFEQKRLEVEIKLKGRIRPFKLLLYLFKLWRTAEFKQLLRNIKKLKEELL